MGPVSGEDARGADAQGADHDRHEIARKRPTGFGAKRRRCREKPSGVRRIKKRIWLAGCRYADLCIDVNFEPGEAKQRRADFGIMGCWRGAGKARRISLLGGHRGAPRTRPEGGRETKIRGKEK